MALGRAMCSVSSEGARGRTGYPMPQGLQVAKRPLGPVRHVAALPSEDPPEQEVVTGSVDAIIKEFRMAMERSLPSLAAKGQPQLGCLGAKARSGSPDDRSSACSSPLARHRGSERATPCGSPKQHSAVKSPKLRTDLNGSSTGSLKAAAAVVTATTLLENRRGLGGSLTGSRQSSPQRKLRDSTVELLRRSPQAEVRSPRRTPSPGARAVAASLQGCLTAKSLAEAAALVMPQRPTVESPVPPPWRSPGPSGCCAHVAIARRMAQPPPSLGRARSSERQCSTERRRPVRAAQPT